MSVIPALNEWFHIPRALQYRCINGFTVNEPHSNTAVLVVLVNEPHSNTAVLVVLQSMSLIPVCIILRASHNNCVSGFTVHERHTGSVLVVSYSMSLVQPLVSVYEPHTGSVLVVL